MKHFTIKEVATIVEGELIAPEGMGSERISQVFTDSRTVYQGENSLFFALKGPRHDGHRFIEEVLKKGTRFLVVSDVRTISPEAVFILVNDTTAALQKLAAFHRRRFRFPVAGITGSNGKTIVKEWLYELLSKERKTVRSPKSYNSQVGVPLSVLLMDENYETAIIEAGISRPGEMEKLARIVDPEIGILTNIGDAHQENFKSREQKTAEKLLLFSNAKALVFCVDDPETARQTKNFCQQHSVEAGSWTLNNKKALIRFEKAAGPQKTTISAFTKGKEYRFTIPFTNDSAVENACHCFAAISWLTDTPEKLLQGFETLAPVEMRLEIKKGINNCLLINDYYNSDLTSLSIALSVLQQQANREHLKKQVILSDIQQTGIPQNELYQEVNRLLKQWQIDEVTGIGPAITAHSASFSIKKSFFPSTEAFIQHFERGRADHSVILIKGARAFTFEKISSLLQEKTHPTVLEINLNAMVHNLNVFRGLLAPGTKMMVMVKAFSYGSGDLEVARMLQYHQTDYLAVAVADEGVALRQAGIQTPVIVMSPEAESYQNMIGYGLEPNIYSMDILTGFEKAVARNGIQEYPIHLKIDTGMNRLGFKNEREIAGVLSIISKDSRLKIQSVFSHLAASDDPKLDPFTREQFSRFDALSKKITAVFSYKIDRHILNSAGIERFPGKHLDMVRLGIGLYGVSVTGLPLENISTFKSTVSQVKQVAPGETVGYGRKGEIHRESAIAVVPVGYADGLDRKLGNGNGEAFVKGKRVPVTGNICMDMLMLDVTGLNVQPGDEVEFFGREISIEEVAEKAGTIPYEILTGISRRVKRIYRQE